MLAQDPANQPRIFHCFSVCSVKFLFRLTTLKRRPLEEPPSDPYPSLPRAFIVKGIYDRIKTGTTLPFQTASFFITKMRKIQIVFINTQITAAQPENTKSQITSKSLAFPVSVITTNFPQITSISFFKSTYTLIIKCSKDLSLTVQAASWAQIPSEDIYL